MLDTMTSPTQVTQHDVAEERHRTPLPSPLPPATTAANATRASEYTKEGYLLFLLLAQPAAVPQFSMLTYPHPPTIHAPAPLLTMHAMCRIGDLRALLAPTPLQLVSTETATTMTALFADCETNAMPVKD